MVTVKGSKGIKYEVKSTLYGTRNLVQRLYFGGIFLSSTEEKGPNGESSSSIETTIRRADERCENLGIEVTE